MSRSRSSRKMPGKLNGDSEQGTRRHTSEPGVAGPEAGSETAGPEHVGLLHGLEDEVARLAGFPSENPNPVLRISGDGAMLYSNRASAPLLEVWRCGDGEPLPDPWRRIARDALTAGRSQQAEAACRDRVFSLTFAPVVDSNYVNVYALDVTDRRRAEEVLRFSHRCLEISNRHTEMKQLLEEFVAEAKRFTGCSAVGIRILDEDGGIAYTAYDGFSREFYESESPLSILTDECMCINVIRGRVDPMQSFYTEYGSFYMNGTTAFLATVPPEEKGRTRNKCNEAGYESVALMPIPLGGRILGLVHVADPREDAVPLETVEALETTALQLGTAIQRVRAEEAVRKARDELENRVLQRTTDLSRTVAELEREIRDRIRAEETIEAERRRLFAVLNMLPGFVALITRDHAIDFANHAYRDSFGEPGDRPCYTVQSDRDKPCTDCPVAGVFETGRQADWEWNRSAGRTYHVWGYPFSDVDGTELVLELGLDITEQKKLEKQILEISEMERRRIGRDLHDTLGQTLTGLAFLIQGLARKSAARFPEDAATADQTVELMKEAIGQVRSMAKGLDPVSLSGGGLKAGLAELAGNVERLLGLSCRFVCEEDFNIEEAAIATQMYYIAQEAVNNAVKHAHPTRIHIRMERSDEGISLAVEDDGVGVPDGRGEGKGMGMRTMRYRAGVIGGSLSVRPGRRGGTVVTCSLPQHPGRRSLKGDS